MITILNKPIGERVQRHFEYVKNINDQRWEHACDAKCHDCQHDIRWRKDREEGRGGGGFEGGFEHFSLWKLMFNAFDAFDGPTELFLVPTSSPTTGVTKTAVYIIMSVGQYVLIGGGGGGGGAGGAGRTPKYFPLEYI